MSPKAKQKTFSLGITGGIGSGKSYVCRRLEAMGVPVFDTDLEARLEMEENARLQIQLSRLTGCPVVSDDGHLQKHVLSAYIRSSAACATQVDALVHPCVRRRMRKWMARQTCGVIAVECALLFESGFDADVDFTVAVTAPEDVRVARVMARDAKPREEVERWIHLQMDEAEKAARAAAVIVNDGVADVDLQLRLLLASVFSMME